MSAPGGTLVTRRVTAEDLLVDWRDGRVVLVESGSEVPLEVRRPLAVPIQGDGPERFRVKDGIGPELGSLLLPLPRGLRTIVLRASIDATGALDLEVKDGTQNAAGSLSSRILAVLEEEWDKGEPWVDEQVVAERLGVPTRREMVLDEQWFATRENLLAAGLIERRVQREEFERGYQERRQLALTERGRGDRYLAESARLESVVRLAEIAEPAPPAPPLEVAPSFALLDSDRSEVIRGWLGGLVLGLALGVVLARACF